MKKYNGIMDEDMDMDTIYISGLLNTGEPDVCRKRFDVLIRPTHALVFRGSCAIFRKTMDLPSHIYDLASSISFIDDEASKCPNKIALVNNLDFLPWQVQIKNEEDLQMLEEYGRYRLDPNGRFGFILRKNPNLSIGW